MKNSYIRVNERNKGQGEARTSIVDSRARITTQGGIVMKEKAKNVKTDKKYWTDPMSFPVYTPKRGR
jgi:hypothetical protein